jgi:uncharacterized membrane-anchored protein
LSIRNFTGEEDWILIDRVKKILYITMAFVGFILTGASQDKTRETLTKEKEIILPKKEVQT